MKRITKQVYGVLRYFQFMNFYVIDTGAGFLVVDTGLDKASVPALERGLQALRASISDVKAILITHGHGDHVGGLPALQERLPNVPTYAHELDAPIIRGEAPPVHAAATDLRGLPRLMRGMLPAKLSPSRVDVEVRDGDVLDDLLPGLTVIHLPGHSYGQIGFWLKELRVFIGGDVCTNTPQGLRMPMRAASPDWAVAKNSIRQAALYDVQVLCLGHGAPITRNAQAALAKLVRRLEPAVTALQTS